MLRDPASALSYFRSHVWSGHARARRESLKAELADAVAQAKESGQLVSHRRSRIARMKEMLAEAAAAALADASDPGADTEGGPGADTAGGGAASAAELRARLELDKEAYREEVAALRELKLRIESVQAGLDTSQRALQHDFGQWHGTALTTAERAERERDGGPPPARRTAWS
jgi:hypothetical protein